MIVKNPFKRLLIRWFVNSLGLWLASRLFEGITYGEKLRVVIVAGLVLAIINASIKPITIVFSLPAILLTLGLFTFVINGLMVLLVHFFYPPFHVASLGAAILAGLMVSLVNYLVTTIIEAK